MYSVRLNRIPENGSLAQPELALSLEQLGLSEPFLAPGATISFELTRMMDKVFGGVKARAVARQTCGKCLVDYDQPLQADFQVMFEPRPEHPGAKAAPADEEDLDDPERVVSFFDGEELPLGEELRQELELQLPFTPRCRKDCKGLCSRCGQDLNVADCGHSNDTGSGHFGALREIFNKPKEA